jgi:hypothetical protein
MGNYDDNRNYFLFRDAHEDIARRRKLVIRYRSRSIVLPYMPYMFSSHVIESTVMEKGPLCVSEAYLLTYKRY